MGVWEDLNQFYSHETSLLTLMQCQITNKRSYDMHGLYIWILYLIYETFQWNIQYNLNGSNPDGSFTVDDFNSLVPTKSFQ